METSVLSTCRQYRGGGQVEEVQRAAMSHLHLWCAQASGMNKRKNTLSATTNIEVTLLDGKHERDGGRYSRYGEIYVDRRPRKINTILRGWRDGLLILCKGLLFKVKAKYHAEAKYASITYAHHDIFDFSQGRFIIRV